MANSFTPLGNRVLISTESQDEAEKMKGGIYIPETAQKSRSQVGDVLAVGEKVKSLQIGDRILMPKFGGTEVEFRGQRLVLIPEDDIMGKVDG